MHAMLVVAGCGKPAVAAAGRCADMPAAQDLSRSVGNATSCWFVRREGKSRRLKASLQGGKERWLKRGCPE
jgi:hypothetical protein